MKHIAYLLILLLFTSCCTFGYDNSISPERYRMLYKGQYWDKQTNTIVQPMFKDIGDRNRQVTEKYACVRTNPNSDIGYLYYRTTLTKSWVGIWDTDYYSYNNRRKCSCTYDIGIQCVNSTRELKDLQF